MNHCDHACDCNWFYESGKKPMEKHKVHEETCASTQPCLIAVHAELNCILFAARHGVATDGAHLHTTLSPCQHCCFLIINAGIKRLVYLKEYRLTEGLDLLENAGIDIEQYVR